MLGTSNLVQRWTTVSTNGRNAKLRQKGSCGGHVTHFWNFGTPKISPERLQVETSNLAQRWMAVSTNEKNARLRSKGVTRKSCDPLFLELWDPPNISGTNNDRNFKFGIDMDGSKY